MIPNEQVTPLDFDPVEVPLEWQENGQVVRVRGTRVPLETIIYEHRKGETPESIAKAFSSLKLRDVYAVITYYLDHQEAVDAYVAEYERQAAAIRQRIEAEQPMDKIRQRIEERRSSLSKKDADS